MPKSHSVKLDRPTTRWMYYTLLLVTMLQSVVSVIPCAASWGSRQWRRAAVGGLAGEAGFAAEILHNHNFSEPIITKYTHNHS